MDYTPVIGIDEFITKFETESRNVKNDFVEALLFTADSGVVMTGNMIDNSEIDCCMLNKIGLWWKPWFFKHVEKILHNRRPKREYIPLRDYYHRHSRSLFWELQDIIPFGNNIFFRILFGWMMPIKVSLLKLTQTSTIKRLYENNHIIQDMLVPIDTMKTCLTKFNSWINVYPIWLCPFNLPSNPGMLNFYGGGKTNRLYVDIGIYGVPKVDDFNPVTTTRKIEDLVVECQGFQMLYADSYRTQEEFRKMFDHRLYDKVRERMNCDEAFPEVYDKINKNVRE